VFLIVVYNKIPHMEELCIFLKKLNDNLKKSMSTFDGISARLRQNNIVSSNEHLDILAANMQTVDKTLEQYKIALSKLEEQYFNDDKKQFVLSFSDGRDTKSLEIRYPDELSCVDYYKKSVAAQIMKHKYSEVLTGDAAAIESVKLALPKSVGDTSIKSDTIILDKIDGVDLQHNFIELPIAKKLDDIPPAFHWYEGDKSHKSGIYISLCKDFHIKVPFPNLLNPAKEFNLKSIKCKYETKSECQTNKKKLSLIYGGEVKECFYVHKKEAFNKVGTQYRCAVETFGNHKILDLDLKRVSNFDIKHLLMYSLSDDILAILWYQNKFKDGRKLVFTNLDVY
jgi:hypothetical protein